MPRFPHPPFPTVASLPIDFFLLLHCLMLSPRNNSSFPNVDASSPRPCSNTAPHKQAVHSLPDQLKQPLDQRLAPVGTFPDFSQPSDAFSDLAASTTISEFVLHAHSDSLFSLQQSFPSQNRVSLSRYHSEPDIRTVAAQAEPSHNSIPSAAEAQNQRRRRSLQHGPAPVLAFPNSAVISTDRGPSTVDIVDGCSGAYSPAEPLKAVTATVPTRGVLPCDCDCSWTI